MNSIYELKKHTINLSLGLKVNHYSINILIQNVFNQND